MLHGWGVQQLHVKGIGSWHFPSQAFFGLPGYDGFVSPQRNLPILISPPCVAQKVDIALGKSITFSSQPRHHQARILGSRIPRTERVGSLVRKLHILRSSRTNLQVTTPAVVESGDIGGVSAWMMRVKQGFKCRVYGTPECTSDKVPASFHRGFYDKDACVLCAHTRRVVVENS